MHVGWGISVSVSNRYQSCLMSKTRPGRLYQRKYFDIVLVAFTKSVVLSTLQNRRVCFASEIGAFVSYKIGGVVLLSSKRPQSRTHQKL